MGTRVQLTDLLAEPEPPSASEHTGPLQGLRAVETTGSAAYLAMERKECRLRPDQLQQLTSLRRLLNRRRAGAGERLTENTLIRVAVDLLLRDSAILEGSTEGGLRRSVGLSADETVLSR
jgi:hypothetical protein